MRVLRAGIWAAIVAILLVAPMSRAQEQSGQQSTSADKPIDSRTEVTPNKDKKTQDSDSELQGAGPGNGSLAGALDFSLSNVEGRRSYWQPLANVTSIIDTNPLTTGQTSGVTSWTAVYAGIDLHRLTRQSDLTLSYLGGGLFSNDGTSNNAALQQFEFGDKLRWGRSALSFFDLLNELPETAFGFNLPLAESLPAGQGLSLQSVFSPNQSILTTRGERIGNASVVEFDRELTPKSSLTFIGGYSLLRFLDNSALLNYGEVTLQGGFDHQLTRHSTMGVLYRFNELRFEGIGQPIDAHTAQLSFGQRVAGRLALRLAAGPAISILRALVPPGGTTGGSTQSTSQVYWTLDSSISYQHGHELFGLAYDHSLSGGGGVLPGAITDQTSGSLSSQLSKALSGELLAGYARNRGLNTPLAPLLGSGQIYNYWFGAVNVSYAWGRWTSVNFNYQAQIQDSNVNSCTGAICGRNLVRQTGSIGLTWRSRPTLLR